MDLVLEADEWHGITAAYQDNVGLWTDGSIENHIDRFKEVGLTFAAKKCHLLYKELCIYGFVISKDGIKVNPKHTKRITEWQTPSTVTEVQLFLGMMNYYRRFIKNFSKVAKPLTDLTKQDIGYQWGTEQEEAFQALKS